MKDYFYNDEEEEIEDGKKNESVDPKKNEEIIILHYNKKYNISKG